MSKLTKANPERMTLLSFRRYIESLKPNQIIYSFSDQDDFIDNALDWQLIFDSIYVSVGQKYIIVNGLQGNVVFRSVLYVTILDSKSGVVRVKITCQPVFLDTKIEYILGLK